MYEAYFGMEHTPFTRDIPPGSLYESPYVADAIGRLTYAADRQLFAVVTSDAGCGKSTLIRKFVATLPKDSYIVLYLSDSKLPRAGSTKGFWISWVSNPIFTGAMPSATPAPEPDRDHPWCPAQESHLYPG